VSEEKVKKQEAYVLFYGRAPDEPAILACEELLKKAETEADTLLKSRGVDAKAGPPALADLEGLCYLSRAWLSKRCFRSRPPPVDNRDLCCLHGLELPRGHVHSNATLVSRTGFDKLVQRFGGGPIVTVLPTCNARTFIFITDA
jgi:hypothetical protein